MSRLGANLVRVEELSQRLVSALSKGGKVRPSLQGPGRDLFARAAAASMADMLSDPGKMIEHQTRYWGRALKHYVEAQSRLAKGQMTPPEDATGRDRRFRDPRWQEHPYFNYLKQQYLIAAEAIAEAAGDLQGLPEKDRRRLSYFAGQIVDMFSPANFLGTNPEALARAVETEGQSLVDGLENLVRDLEANDGELLVTLADRDAFEVGGNLATMPGEVVFRNRLFELIQYAPTTGEVREVPILIFPPWINKFYILDLTERNSLIRWMAAQGFTVLVVSWKNPGPDYADVSLDDYVAEGFLAAIEQARDATGAPEVNVAGYCIAGTTLALTLALMKRRGLGGVRSATFLTTLTDFSDQGEVGVFLDDDFLDGIEAETREAGVLSALFMSRTFSFLRSNDLIYGPAIRSYMMGERPPAFDLLYWNGDATNLPGRMAMQYLRELCQANRFAEGGIAVCGETLRLSDVDLPLVAIACETDHIAAWGQSYAGIRKMGATDRTFVLSESGHIAGIVNPPSKGKYGHYVNGDWSGDANTWRAAAERREGSWWPLWSEWLDLRSGALVPARTPGGGRATLGPAPGTYVTEAPDPGRNA
ncbi:PHA/PHB synthase family protein [Hasllibacter halocynthiae]|nr:class I poly(R)-hydroxyalkanoic acid synthase [Hasllibacter halocynthiae]